MYKKKTMGNMKLARLKNILAGRNEEGPKKEVSFISLLHWIDFAIWTRMFYKLSDYGLVETKRKRKLALQLTINVRWTEMKKMQTEDLLLERHKFPCKHPIWVIFWYVKWSVAIWNKKWTTRQKTRLSGKVFQGEWTN